MSASATSTLAGDEVTFSGVLRPAKRLAGRSVTISVVAQGESTATPLATAVTDATGAYSVSAPLTQSGSYRADFVGDDAYTDASSPAVSIDVSPNPTTIRLGARRDAVYANGYDVLRGRLLSDGTAVNGRKVVITRATASTGTYVPVTTATTDDGGNFRVRVRVPDTGKYRASFAGDALYLGSSAPHVRVTVTPPAATRLLLAAGSPDSFRINAGHSRRLSGILQDGLGNGLSGRTVEVWRRTIGGSTWHQMATVSTQQSGSWRFTVAPKRSSAYRCVFPGTSRYARSTTGLIRIHLR
jgi:5-hydroxyisourate hydrolase-like protein (transthyretin family)